jgi:hypothetical protein
MPYLLKTFNQLSNNGGQGNSVADQLNQWLSFSPGVTPLAMNLVWPEGTSRRSGWVATLMYRQGGPASRFWSTIFTAPAGSTPESKVNTFLQQNRTLIPTLTVVVERPAAGAITRSILLVYAVGNWAQVAAGPRVLVGTPRLAVGVAAMGVFADSGDTLRPVVSALNLGNVNWPAGATGLLFSTCSNNPDRDSLAGVAPCCSTAVPPPAPPSVAVTPLCAKCFPPRIPTA